MKYKYRFAYTFFISVTISFLWVYYDTQPMAMQIMRLRQTENEFSKKLIDLKKISRARDKKNSYLKKDSQTDFSAALVTLARLHGLVLESAEFPLPKKVGNLDVLPIHLIASGHFINLVSFITAMMEQKYPAMLTDFSIKLQDKNTLLMRMNILLLARENADDFGQVHRKAVHYDPFCGTENSLDVLANQQRNLSLLQSASISQFKMVGYIQQGGQMTAMILLPDNTALDLRIGSVIGKERAVVIAIHRDRITLLLPGPRGSGPRNDSPSVYVMRM